MASKSSEESNSHVSAQNHASGCQYLGPGDGDQNVVSSNGVQFNDRSDRRQYTTFALNLQADEPGIPSVWNLAQALKLPRTEPPEPNDANSQHLEIATQATPETGKWVLESEEIRQWKDRALLSHRCLGVHGIRHRSMIIDSLRAEIKEQNDSACIYFYFNEGDDKSPPVARIWSTLLLQLLRHRDSKVLAEELKSKFTNSFRGEAPIHPLEYFSLFKAQSATFKTVYLVIDALDSCTNSRDERTRHIMQEALRQLPTNIRLLFTSRSDSLMRGLRIRHRLLVTPHQQDIRAYVKDEIDKDLDLDQLLADSSRKEEVISKITELTLKSGMFLLAKLHLHNLSKQSTWGDIRMALQQLPATSSRAFEACIRRILTSDNASDTELARHVLTWVVHARMSLTVDQVMDSFAIQKSKGSQYQDLRPSKDSILSSCAGLIVEDHETKTLRLVHKSVRDHLQKHQVFLKHPDLRIAKASLTCLLLREPTQSRSAFFLYSANNWCSHLVQPFDNELKKLVKRLLSDKTSLAKAFKVISATSGRDSEGMTGLHAAVYFDRLAWIKRLLKLGIDINSQCSNGQTALHWAAIYGRHKILDYLVQKSADTNIQDKSGNTALHKLLMGPTTEGIRAVRSLINGGARIDIKGSKGLTPLSSAIRYGPTSIALLLIQSQTDVNAEVTPGWTSLREVFYHAHEMIHRLSHNGKKQSPVDEWTPLRDAVRNHVYCLVHFLLNLGVDLNCPTSDGWLPVLHVVKGGSLVVLDRLLQRQPYPADANQRDAKEGKSALYWAFFYKQRSAIELLIKHGANVNENGPNGWTPLIHAIRDKNEDLVWLLIRAGAQVDQTDGEGWSPLHYAVESKNKNVVWLLVTNKASMKSRHKNVPSALDLALQNVEYSIAWLLCQSGADVNEVDDQGMTLLHRACRDGRSISADVLINHRADPGIKCPAGFNALHYAILGGQEETVEYLVSQGPVRDVINEPDAKGNRALILAILRGNSSMASNLIDNGASCDHQDSRGLTALHHAARMGFHSAIEPLISKAANVDLPDDQGYTVVHHAVNGRSANDYTIELLSDAGANLDVQDNSGLTPLMLAVHLRHVAKTRALLLHGADRHVRNDKGWSAFDLNQAPVYKDEVYITIRELLEETSSNGSEGSIY
ncbi:hypothetical protein FLONG3_6626 [Fusarium longipes]|uniref:Uncharacterized protein n=1 Tax=Fusarium longipes TaxID=694270 RepID=A0A395SJN0_9HYPO|nr:hypothetical protein FLONG3_6626 [Fusarium longipes]